MNRMLVPNLFYPQRRWEAGDYAHLQAKLELFTDFVILSKYRAGEVSETFLVDPLELTAALSDLDLSSGLLPRDCLFWGRKAGQAHLGIYLKPQVWTVTLRGEAHAWRVPLPGLIWAGHGFSYQLWAVTERPTRLDTPLYRAPCPNVHHSVCQGSAPFPQAGADTLWQAVEAFFSSTFNRDLADGKSQAYPGCILDQWRALADSGATEYPLADLIPAEQTLKGVLDGG